MIFWGANFDIVVIFSREKQCKMEEWIVFVTIKLMGVKAQSIKHKK